MRLLRCIKRRGYVELIWIEQKGKPCIRACNNNQRVPFFRRVLGRWLPHPLPRGKTHAHTAAAEPTSFGEHACIDWSSNSSRGANDPGRDLSAWLLLPGHCHSRLARCLSFLLPRCELSLVGRAGVAGAAAAALLEPFT